jgi:hypothetical protein
VRTLVRTLASCSFLVAGISFYGVGLSMWSSSREAFGFPGVGIIA